MNREMQIIRAVSLEADAFRDDAQGLGKRIAGAITGSRGRAQLTGLESIANSSLKVSDVLDYVKKQTGRLREWQSDRCGFELLDYLETKLRARRDTVVTQLQPKTTSQEKPSVEQHVHLLLIREFVRQLVVHAEYSRATRG